MPGNSQAAVSSPSPASCACAAPAPLRRLAPAPLAALPLPAGPLTEELGLEEREPALLRDACEDLRDRVSHRSVNGADRERAGAGEATKLAAMRVEARKSVSDLVEAAHAEIETEPDSEPDEEETQDLDQA